MRAIWIFGIVAGAALLPAQAGAEGFAGRRIQHDDDHGIYAIAQVAPVNSICHKDHTGLALAPTESFADARARLLAAAQDTNGGGEIISVEISDLDCAYCAAAIENAFATKSAFAGAFYDRKSERLYLVTRGDQSVDEAMIEKLVRRRGFSIGEIRHATELSTAIDAPAVTPLTTN